MTFLLRLALAASLLGAAPALAESTMTFAVKGTGPGGTGGYQGTVTVTEVGGTDAAGKVAQVVWTIGSDKITGIGMVSATDRTSLSIAYGTPGALGVAVMKLADDGSASGVWAIAGSDKAGTETWTPAK